MSAGFNLEAFEAALTIMNGEVVNRLSSTDGKLHVITFVRDRSYETGVRPVYSTRVFREGVVAESTTREETFFSLGQAFDLRDSLVESFLYVYEAAPCLLEGAL